MCLLFDDGCRQHLSEGRYREVGAFRHEKVVGSFKSPTAHVNVLFAVHENENGGSAILEVDCLKQHAKSIRACEATGRILYCQHRPPEGSDVSYINRGDLKGGRKASGKGWPIDEARCDAVTKVAVVTVLCWAARAQDRHNVAHAEEVNRLHRSETNPNADWRLTAIERSGERRGVSQFDCLKKGASKR